MAKRFYVIDQGYYRDSGLQVMIDHHPEAHSMVPDVALTEMTKSDRWEPTIHNSLQILSKIPGRCTAIVSVGEVINHEIKTRASADGYLTCREFTPYLRNLLVELHQGADGYAARRLRDRIEAIKQDLGTNELDHLNNKQSLTELIEVTKRDLGEARTKSLRNGSMSRDDRLALIRDTHHC